MISIGFIILGITFGYGIVLMAAHKYRFRVSSYITRAVYGVCFALSLVLFFQINGNENFTLVSSASLFTALSFTASRFSAVILLLGSFIALSFSLYSINHGLRKNALLALSLFGVSGLALSGNLLVLFIFSEILSFVIYLTIGSERKKLFLTKALVFNSISDLAFLTGILLIFSVARSFAFEDISKTLLNSEANVTIFIISGACLLIGALSKAVIFPFHFWMTTDEGISDGSENLLLSLSALPAGIILAIKITPVLAPGIMIAMICMGVVSVVYGLILSGSKIRLKETIRYSAVSQTGLMLIALGTGNTAASILLLCGATISRLALLQSHQLVNNGGNGNQSILHYWLLFGSVIAFAGLPISALFTVYANVVNGSLAFNYIPGLGVELTILILFAFFIQAFNIFKFIFRIDKKQFVGITISSSKKVHNIIGITLLLLASLFVWYGISPVDASQLWLSDHLNLPPSLFSGNSQIMDIPFLGSILVLFSMTLGIIAAYIFVLRGKELSYIQTQRFNRLEIFVENVFAGILIPKAGASRPGSTIKLFSRTVKFDELSAYISFSLLIIVIFYFIFRTM